jgi:hypothetical protein
VPIDTKIILSSHNFQETPPADQLQARAEAMWDSGADIVKIATMANDITDSAAVLSLLQNKKGEWQGHNTEVPGLWCKGGGAARCVYSGVWEDGVCQKHMRHTYTHC